MSKKVLGADNQQESSKVQPWYITGFVEGEGTFHIAFYKDKAMKMNLKVIPEFHINQSYLRIETLEKIKNYFQCGYIKANHPKNKKDTTYVYVVRERNALLKKIIPFFGKYPFLSQKQKSFNLFKQIVKMMNNGLHRRKKSLKRIVDLAYQMNVEGKYRMIQKSELLKSSETVR